MIEEDTYTYQGQMECVHIWGAGCELLHVPALGHDVREHGAEG